MNKRESIQTRLFVCLTLLLISKCTGVAANTASDKHSACPVMFSSGPDRQIKYHVFVSFRGGDIRRHFLSHLLEALSRKKIVAFSDKKLTTGDDISAIHGAIEVSSISLVIFSPDFASSLWCLDELVKIVECRAKYGQILMPVFYQIHPSDVRHQTGTYGDAFVEHEKKYNMTKVLTWRSALGISANISGMCSSKFSDDAKLVEEIVKGVLTKLNQEQQVKSKGLVGIEKPISHIESLLRLESEEVRVLGIWGMPGIGKTTIAEEVFNRIRSGYESSCFMASVREKSERYETNTSLRKKLLSTLLEEEDLTDHDMKNGLPPFVVKRLRRMKVVIVLDDVKDSRQLEILVGAVDWLGPGSRIIITARDKQVLAKKANDIYEVGALGFDESFRLFNLHAFNGPSHVEMEEYYKLSRKMVNYAKGVPLVLEGLAHLLYGKNEDIWESQSKKLKKEQIENVHSVFKLIYDDLDNYEKKIFLDIACFFDGLNMKVDHIKLLLKDRYYSVDTRLERLKDKALVTISQQNVVSMHDIIQETAWEIVRQESIEEPGSRSRLLDPDDISQVLKNNKGSETIRSMAIKPSVTKGLLLSPQVFAKMSKLQFLDIYTKGSQDEEGLHLPQGLESLPNELRYLRWEYYPLESLPSKFSAENLVILNMPYSQLKKIWHEGKDLVNLNVLILHSSTHLMELPDLSKATSLKKLDLSGCISLTSLQSNIHFSSLSYLHLYNCTALKEFSVTSENMKLLNLELTGIKQLPSSFGLQTRLEKLHLGHTHIENLPESIKNLTKLRHLDLHHCKELQSLPELPPSLETLDASGCVSLENVMLPSTAIEQMRENKTRVTFWNCLKLNEHSLKAIELNAQINMMNFVYQHISKSDHDHDAQGMYVYPGSKVPKWLEYSTTHDYMTVDLSSAPYFPQLGFIFCFIIPTMSSEGLILKFKISDGEGEGVKVYMDRPHHGIESDHVYLMYDPRSSHYLASQANDQSKIKIKVKATSRTLTSQYVPVQLRGFGVSLVTSSQYEKVTHQLELGNGSVIPHNMCSVEEESKYVPMQLRGLGSA